jgi:hypothetical protein
LLAGSLGLFACSEHAAPPLDACQLITRDQIAALLGDKPNDPVGSSEVRGTITTAHCRWSAMMDARLVYDLVARNEPGSAELQASVAATIQSEYPDAVEQPMLGDRALFVPSLSQLHVLFKDDYFIQTVERAGDRDKYVVAAGYVLVALGQRNGE